MLDQLPTTTPKAKATANQKSVAPPKKINAIKGRSVVPLVYKVLVNVAETALSICSVYERQSQFGFSLGFDQKLQPYH